MHFLTSRKNIKCPVGQVKVPFRVENTSEGCRVRFALPDGTSQIAFGVSPNEAVLSAYYKQFEWCAGTGNCYPDNCQRRRKEG
jgi:hypothetical protein